MSKEQDLGKELANMRKKVENAEAEVNRLQGQRDNLLQQLKNDSKVDTVEEARQKLQELNEQYKTTKQELQKQIKEIREKYDL